MLVSIIIPVYNVGPYVKVAIASVLNQTVTEGVEIIAVDDGSTDDSYTCLVEIAKTDSRIKIIKQNNRGVSAARNAGMRAATGKYVVFLDADDIMPPNALEILISGMEADERNVLSSGSTVKITSYDQPLDKKEDAPCSNTTENTLEKLLSWKYSMSACAKLFVKELIGDITFVEGKKINEDKFFLAQYLIKNRGLVYETGKNVYGYYTREGSASMGKFLPKDLDAIYFSERIEQEVNSAIPELSSRALYNSLATRLQVLKKIVRTDCYKENRELFFSIRKDTVALSKKVPWSWGYKAERFSLALGGFAYRACVKLFLFITGRK